MTEATQSDGERRAAVREVEGLLQEFHRALIQATRAEYERTHGRIQGPYALLNSVMQDPAFAWLRPMSGLLVDIDALLECPEVTDTDAAAVRVAVRRLLTGSDDPEYAAQLEQARESEPAAIIADAHLRAALGALPEPDPEVENAVSYIRSRWEQRRVRRRTTGNET